MPKERFLLALVHAGYNPELANMSACSKIIPHVVDDFYNPEKDSRQHPRSSLSSPCCHSLTILCKKYLENISPSTTLGWTPLKRPIPVIL